MSDVSVVLDWSDAAVWECVQPGDGAVARPHQLARALGGGGRRARSHRPPAPRALAVPGRASRPARRQHAARARVGGVRRAARRSSPRSARACRCCSCRRCRRPVGSPSTASTCSSATASGCRSTARSTPATARCAYSDARAEPLGGGAQRRPLRRGRRGRDPARTPAAIDRRAPRSPRRSARGARAAAPAVGDPRCRERRRPAHDRRVACVRAEDAGSPVIVRCSPAFVVALTGSAPRTAPAPSGERGVLVVCGSFVPATTAQLERLEQRHPEASVPARVAALAGDGADAEVERISPSGPRAHRDGRARRGRDGARARPGTRRRREPAARRRRAGTGRATRRRGRRDRKGRDHLGRDRPRRPGRQIGARDRADRPRRRALAAVHGTDYAIVPGNVGGPELLADVVDAPAPRRRVAHADAVRRPARGAPRRAPRWARSPATTSRRPRPSLGAAAAAPAPGVILLIGGRSLAAPGGDLLLAALRGAAGRAQTAACVQLDHCDDLGA